MVHVLKHFASSQPPSRTSQHSSRYKVQDDKGQMGLAITPLNLLLDQSEMGPICSGPTYIQTHITNCQHISAGDQILRHQRLMPPSNDCSSSLEESVLVFSFALPTNLTSPSHSISTRSTTVAGVSATSIPATRTSAVHMAHLRVFFCQAEKFSKQASELLLASWRDKSTKA